MHRYNTRCNRCCHDIVHILFTSFNLGEKEMMMLGFVLKAITGVFTAPMGFGIVGVSIVLLGALFDFMGGCIN